MADRSTLPASLREVCAWIASDESGAMESLGLVEEVLRAQRERDVARQERDEALRAYGLAKGDRDTLRETVRRLRADLEARAVEEACPLDRESVAAALHDMYNAKGQPHPGFVTSSGVTQIPEEIVSEIHQHAACTGTSVAWVRLKEGAYGVVTLWALRAAEEAAGADDLSDDPDAETP